MSFSMKSLELFCSFIKFDLRCLCLSYFFFKFLSFLCNFNSKFLNIQGQFFNLSFISSSIFFHSQVIFFFLSCSKCPLFKFFLIPIHFKLKLIHLLIGFEDHILNIVESILLISNSLLKLFNFISQSATLSFCNLF
jgi:hypothetical protein